MDINPQESIPEDLFPCWGTHARMGRKTTTGYFSIYKGTLLLCVIPALGEAKREILLWDYSTGTKKIRTKVSEATPEQKEIVELGGY